MQAISNILLRPYRSKYNAETDLGPRYFMFQETVYERIDLILTNAYNLKLQCSLFVPQMRKNVQYDCILYCHGNCGNRLSGFECIDTLIAEHFAFFFFDFSGAGMSEGDIVSMGFYEKYDVDCIVQYLSGLSYIRNIALWGRSLGAVSAILYSACLQSKQQQNYGLQEQENLQENKNLQEHQKIQQNQNLYQQQQQSKVVCLILDSPFSNISEIIELILSKHRVPTQFLRRTLVNQLKKSIERMTNLNLDDFQPENYIHRVKVPALFIHSTNDELVPCAHSKTLAAYLAQAQGQENASIIEVNGSHNQKREFWVYQRIKDFMQRNFQKNTPNRNAMSMSMSSAKLKLQQYYFNKFENVLHCQSQQLSTDHDERINNINNSNQNQRERTKSLHSMSNEKSLHNAQSKQNTIQYELDEIYTTKFSPSNNFDKSTIKNAMSEHTKNIIQKNMLFQHFNIYREEQNIFLDNIPLKWIHDVADYLNSTANEIDLLKCDEISPDSQGFSAKDQASKQKEIQHIKSFNQKRNNGKMHFQ